MSWITENPWPLMLVLAGVGAVLLIVGGQKAKFAALAFLAASVGLHFLEASIVTPSEQVEHNLEAMLDSFIAEDMTAIHRLIADDSPGLKEKAEEGVKLVRLNKSFHMQDVIVTVSDDEKSAEVQLRANGSLTVRQGNMPYHAATRWRTLWIVTNGTWKLREVHRLNPMTGDEIGILDRQ